MTERSSEIVEYLDRIANALERLAPNEVAHIDLSKSDTFIWRAEDNKLDPVHEVNRLDLSLLQGIKRQRDTLMQNTRQFASGLSANNALLWGARGMGKSSLVKALHAEVSPKFNNYLKLIEIHREDMQSLPILLRLLRKHTFRFVLFCDDLSFDHDDTSYKSLKAVLDGGVEGRPSNVIFYATSNRRHLMLREMVENEKDTAINPGETVDEKISLSDRFGLWLGFHNCSQAEYLKMLRAYCDYYCLRISDNNLRSEGIEWAVTRGARNGRVAWQFIQDLAGKLGATINRLSMIKNLAFLFLS